MKLKIGDYEVVITAMNTAWGDKKTNKRATMSLLNEISIWADVAADRYEEHEYNSPLTKEARECADEIYRQLKAAGCYAGE